MPNSRELPKSIPARPTILERLWEHTPDGIFLVDEDGRFIDVNQSGCESIGYTRDEVLALGVWNMDPSWDQQRWRRFCAETRPGEIRTLDVLHTRKDGSTLPIEVRLCLLDLGGRRVALGIARDLTDRRQAEELLRASEERFRLLLENAGDGVVVLDPEGRVRDVNQRICNYLRYSREELLGLRVWDFVVGMTREGFRDLFDNVKRLSPMTREGLHRRKDGTIYPTEVRICTLEFEGAWWMLALVRDVTERRRMEEQLRDSERRLARTLDSAMDAILVFDDQRRVSYLNPAAEKVFACAACDKVGESLDGLLTAPLTSVIQTYLSAGSGPDKKISLWAPDGMRARRKNGEEFPIDFTISSFELSSVRLHTMILRDVNDRAQAEAALHKLGLEKAYLQQELTTQYNVHNMVGTSGVVQEVFRSVEHVAPTDSTVLLTGETGTGKELIARAIHEASRRRDRVLVKVNCAALPAGLIESELFGHEKGAFTGAVSRRAGRFETADGGTLLLDEIAELPLEMQAKLLRVLQEGEFERVGSTQTIRVDVRMIAATNRDLEDAVARGTFRSDLFYRVNVFPIHLPPLRDRQEDIPPLVSHFVLAFSKKLGRHIVEVPPGVLKALCAYSWPGNVRELENVIERAVILSSGPELELGRWFAPVVRTPATRDSQRLDQREREHIVAVLERTGWQVSGDRGAAEILGLKPTTLESRMKKLGIARPI